MRTGKSERKTVGLEQKNAGLGLNNVRLEMKISLPLYKIAYSLCFTVILSMIRGVILTYEIGISMEAPMALLALVFCADTYVQEITGRRSEVWRLYPMKNKLASMALRMGIQEGMLFLLSAAGYGMFILIQRPLSLYTAGESTENEWSMFLGFLLAMFVTLWFWGMFSAVLSCLLRSQWAGIGCGLVLWLVTNSTFGKAVLGDWNLFSYTFRDIENGGDLSWLWGKALCAGLCVIMALLAPQIMRKRG